MGSNTYLFITFLSTAGGGKRPLRRDLLNPSLLKRARALSGRPPLAFSRSPLDSLLAGFLLLFLILDDFHSVLHPRIFSLSRLTGWASTPAVPHYILEKNYWEEAEWTLRLLRRYVSHVSASAGLVKLLALSNQQAVSSARRVCLTGLRLSFVVLSLSTITEYPYQCTLRLWYLEAPITFVQRTGTATVSAFPSSTTPPWQ